MNVLEAKSLAPFGVKTC